MCACYMYTTRLSEQDLSVSENQYLHATLDYMYGSAAEKFKLDLKPITLPSTLCTASIHLAFKIFLPPTCHLTFIIVISPLAFLKYLYCTGPPLFVPTLSLFFPEQHFIF